MRKLAPKGRFEKQSKKIKEAKVEAFANLDIRHAFLPDKGAVRREVRTADDKAPVVFLSVELLHIADGLGG